MTSSSPEPSPTSFADLGLPAELLAVLDDVGYESPSPIQAMTIPALLAGGDVLGQAQTGTGKTAAFALPLLARIDRSIKGVQGIVLTPTRELAIQVAEAFQKYAAKLAGFRVLPVYGGQEISRQVRSLDRGVHVVVGTPGRVLDHLRRKTLRLDGIKTLVLDEADEMLRMGFLEDVETILEQTPSTRQIALFSATLPAAVRKIASRHLNEPREIRVESSMRAAETVRQRFWIVQGSHKLDALTRVLEVEDFDGVLVFVRTKTATVDLAAKLEARGYASQALNGDIAQNQREATVDRFKGGQIDVLVATDVAARGLDVDRISHVVNYDIPYDTEAYVHRIGRTGRAGRTGDAILFVAPRERRMLGAIEHAIGTRLEAMVMPTVGEVNTSRISRFKKRIEQALESESDGFFEGLVTEFLSEHGGTALEVAAALARLLQDGRPLLLKDEPPARRERTARSETRLGPGADDGLEAYRIEVGRANAVNPGQIVGAITNEVGLRGDQIGRIDIQTFQTIIFLPRELPRAMLMRIGRLWICRRQLRIVRLSEVERAPRGKERAHDGGAHRKHAHKKK